MGRLEDIVERNKHPRRHRKQRFPYGIALSLFVLIILVLVIFTDFGVSKEPPPPPVDHTRVEGVKLMRVPSDARRD